MTHGTRQTWRSAITVAITGLLLAAPGVFAAVQFTDVPANNWANPYIQYLTQRGIITGYPDNSFRPNHPVTRAEFAVMLAKSKGLTASAGPAGFIDVPESHWAAQAIQAVSRQGWIAGYPGGQFRPNQNISMAEMYAILSKASGQPLASPAEADTLLQGFTDAQAIPGWARVSVATAVKNGISVDELSPKQLYPNTQAARASVASAIAKLVNPTMRDQAPSGSTAQQPTQQQLGASVDVTGTLQATATPGEWVIVTPDGKRYFFTNPGNIAKENWFRVGNRVHLTGTLDAQNSNNLRQVVQVKTLAADTVVQNQVTITGTIRPSTATQGAWLIETSDNKRYRILNPDIVSSSPLLRFGANVTASGNLRPDVNLPATEGTALVLSKLETAQTTQEVSLTGKLQPTVEAGGWTITTSDKKQKYVLLGTQPSENQPWFKEGTEVMVKGSVRTDIPTIYQEGPVLVINSIQPSPTATTGTQAVELYFPNLVNIVKDPATMLGNPLIRPLQGPNIPQQAIQAILKGPSDTERLQGFFVDDEIKRLNLETFKVEPNGEASVVLEAPADFKFKSSLTPQRLDEQLTRTLRQFTGIKEVKLSVQGPDNQVIWNSP
jgi:hypothetical protein